MKTIKRLLCIAAFCALSLPCFAQTKIAVIDLRKVFDDYYKTKTADATLKDRGTDLEKDIATQLLAYDDPAGVTAAFNMNVLARINRELGADFNLKEFAHEARWNAEQRRIEMHLRSLRRQRVNIPGANLRIGIEPGETIWTESSHKYAASEPAAMAARTGFHCEAQWIDEEWPFAQNLWIVE